MSEKETREFQAEVKQLLHLMINSLYSNKEIFLRELVSNAADACDKLRFEAVQDGDLMEGDDQLRIQVEHDAQARTVTIRDNGIGMSRDEVVENIGTIAHSGTRRFLNQLSGDQAADAKLIGEFGVGFYSAFIVADRVTLTTRRAGQPRDAAVRWESEGLGEYSIETVDRAQRGTEVVLHLREGEDEFLDQWRLRHVITRYSDHIDIPVELKVERPSDDDSESGGAAFEQINRASALWTRPKSEISDDDYTELYKHVAHDFEDPLAWTHNRVEGRYEYISLLYIPRRAPFDLYTQERSHGVKLYVKRVFILDDASELLPRYLRFVRGVIDSNDLPLNVSRELLQGSRVVDSIRSGSTKKVLGLLGELAGEDSDRYRTFWEQFGKVLKEGIVEDPTNRDALAKLLRFASTKGDGAEQTVSVADYVGRMKEGQDTIYYLTADSYAAASGSPHLEVFRKNDVEVLLLYDRVDEWLLSQLSELDGKPLHSVAKGDIDLSKLDTDAARAESVQETDNDEPAETSARVLEPVKEALGERVQAVRASKRLVDSPACLVIEEHDMALHMQRLLKEAGQSIGVSKPILELNLEHPLVKRLAAQEPASEGFSELSLLLFEQALLAEGGQLEDPASFVRRMNHALLAEG